MSTCRQVSPTCPGLSLLQALLLLPPSIFPLSLAFFQEARLSIFSTLIWYLWTLSLEEA